MRMHVICVVVAVLLGYVTNVQAINVTFQQGINGYNGTKDTFINSEYPAESMQNKHPMEVVVDYATLDHALIQFNDVFGDGSSGFSQVPLGPDIEIVSAKLKVYSFDEGQCGSRIHQMLMYWEDDTVWNDWSSGGNGIQLDDQEAVSLADDIHESGPIFDGPSEEGWVEFDIVESIIKWHTGEFSNYGWTIQHWVENSDGWHFRSSEYTENIFFRPIMEIEYVPEPATLLLFGLGGLALLRKHIK